MAFIVHSFTILVVIILFVNFSDSKWAPVGNGIKTRWAATVDPLKVWPEYPRPQLVRDNWVNLNGLWEYSITPIAAAEPNAYDGQILVPFPVESSLSGVGKEFHDNQALWYKRQFTAPAIGANELLILNLGAVDYYSHVFINGHSVGEHKGGFSSFSFDITKFLDHNIKEQVIVVKVIDATGGAQPTGKQVPHPSGGFYSAVSGIWRTVWLEKVPKEYVESLKIVPDIDTNSVHITINTNNPSDHLNNAVIEILDKNGKIVSTHEKSLVNKPNQIVISNPKLWSTTDPYLYELKIKLGNDSISSYFGLRKIEMKKDAKGFNRFFLNHKPLFMFAALDQGYWPDGVYVPPSDEAMKFDIEMELKIGFNTARKHMKIENDRWYYWADKLGLLVWQDFPAAQGGIIKGAPDNTRNKADSDQIELEMERMVTQLYNHPSIVVWITFNENWGQYDTARIVALFRKWDPTRLIDESSGGNDHHLSDIRDYHSYPDANRWPNEKDRIVVQGEYGGVGLFEKAHAWQQNVSKLFHFATVNSTQQWQKWFIDKMATIRANALVGLGGAVYTQITDIDFEDTGILTFDRAFEKFTNISQLKYFSDKFYPSAFIPNIIIASAHHSNKIEWHYTTKSPEANWTHFNFDDSHWSKGMSGFGTKGTPDIRINTEWNTTDIWLRKKFVIETGKLPKHVILHLFYDDIAQVFINGIKVDNGLFDPYISRYAAFDVDPHTFKVGDNVIAVHCHQLMGSQGIDVGVLEICYDC